MLRSYPLSKPRTFLLLMLLCALTALLPLSWTRCADGVLQPMGCATWPIATATRAGSAAVGVFDGGIGAAEAAALREEVEALRRQVGHLSLTLGEAERRVTELSSIRDQLRDYRTMLRIARVVGSDASPRRETLTISRGQRDGVEVGQWVVAGTGGAEESDGRAMLSRVWLVGRIVQAHPLYSVVRLASDPQSAELRVRLAKALPDGRWEVVSEAVLTGAGGGRMTAQVAETVQKAGVSQVLAAASSELPFDLLIGQVTSARRARDQDAALFFDLEIRAPGDPWSLRDVYVIVPGR